MQPPDTAVPATNGNSVHIFGEEFVDTHISVLIVDDDPDVLDLTATFLERERDEFTAYTETSASDALNTLNEHAIEVIVSDYDMREMNGLEFLEAIREQQEDIPFILYTGKGSEEIASEAISKGVTDYLQKETNSTQYSLLANRICNAVEQYRAEKVLKHSEEKFSKLVMNSSDVIAIVDEHGEYKYVSPAAKRVLGYEQEELIGTSAFEYMPPDDRQDAMEVFFQAIENPEMEPSVEFRFKHPDGGWTDIEARGKNMFDDAFINGFVVNGRDVTELREQQRELTHQNEQLVDMRQAITHELRSPIGIARDSLTLYREIGDEEFLDKIERATTRVDTLLDQIVSLANQESEITTMDQVSLDDVVQNAWELTEPANATLLVTDSKELEADPDRLQQVFENLIRNAIEHSSGDVTIRIGTTQSGVYIEDTGPGIPEEDREKIFESGYTTSESNTGFGLNIVKQIVLGHGWEIDVSESEEGGARFEIDGVTFQPAMYE